MPTPHKVYGMLLKAGGLNLFDASEFRHLTQLIRAGASHYDSQPTGFNSYELILLFL